MKQKQRKMKSWQLAGIESRVPGFKISEPTSSDGEKLMVGS